MTNSTRTLRACATGALALALAASLLGCSNEPGLRDRYVAEKLAWKAAKSVNAMRLNPELATDEMKESVADIYREIVDRFPPPEDVASLSQAERDVAAIAARSAMELASMAAQADDADEALRLYAYIRDRYSYDRNLTIESTVSIAGIHEARGEWDAAVLAYESLMTEWPPAASEGEIPDPRILRAPVRIATGYVSRGDVANGREWFGRARDYYERCATSWPGSSTAELAMSFRAETFLMEERWADAAAAYEELDRDYGHDANRPNIWLVLADTYANRLDKPATARSYYLKLLESYPENIGSATASLALADEEIADGDHETARARLTDVVERFPREESIRATAIQYLAVSYESEGLWDEATLQLNALAREHPTTLYGLTALQHIVEHYEQAGEAGAAEAALERAADHYERVVRDFSSTPAELAARGYLIDTRLRQEKWADAARVLVETGERFPRSPSSSDMMLQAADIYETRLSDQEEAIDVLRSLIALFPETPPAAAAARRLERLSE